jgi:hypothetical protein
MAPKYRRVRSSPAMRAWLGERDRSMVWPKEAPPLPAEERAEFAEFRIESGLPEAEFTD